MINSDMNEDIGRNLTEFLFFWLNEKLKAIDKRITKLTGKATKNSIGIAKIITSIVTAIVVVGLLVGAGWYFLVYSQDEGKSRKDRDRDRDREEETTIAMAEIPFDPDEVIDNNDNVLRINPSDGVMAEIKKKSKNRPEPRHALTIVEQRAFLDFLDRPENERWKPLFVTMFGTGCRVGEVIGLTWDDVDFDANTISINHNLTYHPMTENGNKCEFDLTLPKTAAGIRTIPILDNVREVLLEELEYQRDTGMRCVSEVQGMRGFIFFNRFGTIHNPQAINKAIKRLVDDHNCEEEIKAAREGREPILIPRFSCHITRHTFCTRLCESNNNVKLIQTIMGHKDIQTTLDIYAEISEAK